MQYTCSAEHKRLEFVFWPAEDDPHFDRQYMYVTVTIVQSEVVA